MRATIFTLLILLISGFCLAADPAKPPRPEYENEHFRLRFSPNTPNQMAGFYTGRGFPDFAIEEVKQYCFITTGLRNKSNDTVWLDMHNWRFSTEDGELKRYERSYWPPYWTKLGLEKRFQSTFRWTLIPEQLDFHPNEGEGGNIVLARTRKPITLTASIAVGKDKHKVYDIRIDNLYCAYDEP
jgi:hypothetical protein